MLEIARAAEAETSKKKKGSYARKRKIAEIIEERDDRESKMISSNLDSDCIVRK